MRSEFATGGAIQLGSGYGRDLLIDDNATPDELDDAIVLCGNVGFVAGGSSSLARFEFEPGYTCIPDTSFGTDGIATFGVGTRYYAAYGLVCLPDDRLVTAGTSSFQSLGDVAVTCHDGSDGSLDGGFGDGGKSILDFLGYGEMGYSVAVDGSGNVLVAAP